MERKAHRLIAQKTTLTGSRYIEGQGTWFLRWEATLWNLTLQCHSHGRYPHKAHYMDKQDRAYLGAEGQFLNQTSPSCSMASVLSFLSSALLWPGGHGRYLGPGNPTRGSSVGARGCRGHSRGPAWQPLNPGASRSRGRQ